MFTSAELIQALQRRLRRSIRPQAPGETFPPGWQAWLASMRRKAGAVTGAPAQDIVAVLLGRLPEIPPGGIAHMTRWRAFGTLWRQPWEPPGEDERGLRVLSCTMSILIHIAFVVMLLWLMHARFLWMAPAPAAQRGEHVIEVTFIGDGTPEEEGGAPPPEAPLPEQDAPAVEAPAAQAPPPRPVQQPDPAPSVAADTEPVAPVEPAPPPDQPLVVTETSEPDSTFLIPPAPTVELPSARVREVEVAPRTRDIEVVEIRELERPQVRQAEMETVDLAQPELEVAEREIAVPGRPTPVPQVAAPGVETPDLAAEASQPRVRDIPMPARQAGRAEQAAEAAAATGSAEPAPAGARTPAADAAGRQPDAAPAGAGTASAPDAGAWQTPQRGDDWGASASEQRGGQGGTSSLFNPDGSPRLPPGGGDGVVGGGLPPGTITEDYERIDRMGTWLRRPPTDYEPTSFDRFWVPHENLLEEWVRRSVRTVLIRIPGTSKTIRCDIVTLAVSGGCGIIDPNLQDNPAGARPPPDVPFRPELQEDQDSLSDDVWR